jgi:hypothetical protein
MPFVGFDWRYRKQMANVEKNLFGQTNTKDNRTQFSLGVAYTLPMLVNFTNRSLSRWKCKSSINKRGYS